jgi:hypothetical protein
MKDKVELRPNVPCGACHACCRHEYVMLLPEYGDDVASFDHVPLPGTEYQMLRHKTNGECVYLDEHGCTIHDRAPVVCKKFDCRAFFLGMTRNERRMYKHAKVKSEIFKAARERLSSLTPGEVAEINAYRMKREEY